MSWCCPRSSKPVWGAKASRAGSIPVRFRDELMIDPEDKKSRLVGEATTAAAGLRALPAVGAVLARPAMQAAVARHGHATVRAAVREAIGAARRRAQEGANAAVSDADVLARAERLSRGTLRPVINATGVLVHTNLGRSPLAAEALDAVHTAGAGYATLEYDLEQGARGERHVHARDLLVELTGAEDALVVNNNAAAVMLSLATLAAGREVVVSRGELVEIGGGFRIPDVLAQSGAKLVEVGTTNRTHRSDYERAIGASTALLLKVHRSNFEVVGFTSEVPIGVLAEVAREKNVPLACDAGSGCLVGRFAGDHEPTVASLVADGADFVTFSGDKLLGGPQAGIVVGRSRLLEPMRRHPLMRALRADKLCLAALVATLRLWRDAPERVPLMRLIAEAPEALEARCHAIACFMPEALRSRLTVVPTIARIGGGAAPSVELESRGLRVEAEHSTKLASRLRTGPLPVIARVDGGAVVLDLRAVFPDQDVSLATALAGAMAADGNDA